MKYVSIDIETTGLNRETCQILQIGAIIEDTTKYKLLEHMPTFNCVVIQEEIVGEPFALNMNKRLIKLTAKWLTSNEEERKELKEIYNLHSFAVPRF